MKIALALFLTAATAGAALAQSSFYVVQDVKTHHCTIVDRKPADTTTMTIVGGDKVFTTRSEAEAGMKSVKVCTSD